MIILGLCRHTTKQTDHKMDDLIRVWYADQQPRKLKSLMFFMIQQWCPMSRSIQLNYNTGMLAFNHLWHYSWRLFELTLQETKIVCIQTIVQWIYLDWNTPDPGVHATNRYWLFIIHRALSICNSVATLLCAWYTKQSAPASKQIKRKCKKSEYIEK